MAATAQYAFVARTTKKVQGFISNPDSADLTYVFLVDMTEHPQADVVETGWYYNETTNTFSATSGATKYVYAVKDTYDVVTGLVVVDAETTETGYVSIPSVDTSIIGLVHYGTEFVPVLDAIWRAVRTN